MRIIVILVSCIICNQLFAQEHIVFSSINANNGLSDNSVRSICQLHDGRIIIVTLGMVNIYDGSSFLHLHYSDEKAYTLSKFYGWHITYIDSTDNIWLKNQYKLYLFDVRKESYVPNIDSIFFTYGIKDHVTDFIIDSEYNFWFITDKNELLFRKSYEERANLFITDVTLTNYPDEQLIDIEINKNELFFFYKSGVMVCYDINTREEKYRDNPFEKSEDLYSSTIAVLPYNEYLYQVRNGNVKGISVRYNVNTRSWDRIIETDDCWQNTLTLDSKGNCWISTFQGLWLIDKNLKNKRIISPIQLVDGRLFETEITTQYNDNNGGLWVGSINRGLLYYHPDRFKFRNFGRTLFKLNDNEKLRVNCFSEIDNNLLVGTQNGLYLYSKKTESLVPFNRVPKNAWCTMLLKDSKQQIWLSTLNYGLFCITNENIKHYSKPIYCHYIYEALDGHYYVCTDNSFGILEPSTGSFERIEPPFGHNLGYTYYIVQFGKNKLIGNSCAGLFIYNCIDKTITFPDREREKETIFQHDNFLYHCIYLDSRGLMWFGTQDGLYVYDSTANSIQSFHVKDGLVNNAIRSIIEDDIGNVWVSTSNGISCIEISGNKTNYHYSFINYNHYDGVIENEFLPRSVFKTSDNYLLWGGLDGFNEINLNRIDSSKQQLSTPLITEFMLFSTEIKVGEKYDGDIILNQSLSTTKQIDLKHFQNFVSFEFSALNYVNPTQTYYKYKLEGVDVTWNEVSSTNGIGHANYTNLPPGTYNLKVYAANNNRKWGDICTEMTIVVHPPIWKTTLAYFLYIILFLGVFSYLMYTYHKWHKQKIIKKQKDELDEMKLSFYTNISHELRTPLTLILTPLGSIIKKLNNELLKKQLIGIYNNAKDLLKLVNQLLDFRKLEMKRERLQLSYCDVDEFLEELAHPFEELANEKRVKFTYKIGDKNLHAFLDKSKLQKIISNLLSNALKFTPKGGDVKLSLYKISQGNESASKIAIQVSDTGCGIPENDLSHIFDRFYQCKHNNQSTGSGIGLYLVKEYVQMLNGSIDVKSQLGQGSTFRVEIPVDLQSIEEKRPNTVGRAKKPAVKILLIEDNEEFKTFLYNELAENYKIITASNGIEGLLKTREEHPDLVISDIMMPKMSGTEFCDKLKHDIHISHIPVILLTARTSENFQVEGFRVRADAYITKPFNMEILQLRIQNLIEQQEKRKELFKNAILLNPDTLTSTDIDKELIKKALTQIEKNIDNSSYSVEQLSSDLFMERTGLYRKIIAIVGQTPTKFIRSIRLKKAAHLLKKGQLVYDVSENVGFGSTSYFIKCFQKEFGMKPSQYRHNNLVTKVEY
jgi:DNA-binding response OmpR family regulator/ligand-binding sensor domain-containing protein/nitrogen-specific signal transduction histidine kinase